MVGDTASSRREPGQRRPAGRRGAGRRPSLVSAVGLAAACALLLPETVHCTRPSAIDEERLALLEVQAAKEDAGTPVVLSAVDPSGGLAPSVLGQFASSSQELERQEDLKTIEQIQEVMLHGSALETLPDDSNIDIFAALEDDVEQFRVTFSEATFGSPGCPCIGIRGLPGVRTFQTGNTSSTYPPDAGMYCEAWDDGRYASDCEAGGMPGQGNAWCAAKWCFVDPCNCAMVDKSKFFDAKMQYHGRPVYVSYATCGDDVTQHGSKLVEHEDFTKQCQMESTAERCLAQGRNSSCIWTGKRCLERSLKESCEASMSNQQFGDEACRCVNVEVPDALSMQLASPEAKVTHDDLGGRCNSWEAIGAGIQCTGAPGEPSFCKTKWCFVDPCTCPLENFPAIADRSLTIRGVPVHFSYQTCNSNKSAGPMLKHSCTSFKDYMSCHENATMACVWDVDRCIKEGILKQCILSNEPGSEDFERHSKELGARESGPQALVTRTTGLVAAGLLGLVLTLGLCSMAWKEMDPPPPARPSSSMPASMLAGPTASVT